jgi:hypothetical protein
MVNIENEAAKSDKDGSYPNDKRGISFGVIGHASEEWVDKYFYSKDHGLFTGYNNLGPADN